MSGDSVPPSPRDRDVILSNSNPGSCRSQDAALHGPVVAEHPREGGARAPGAEGRPPGRAHGAAELGASPRALQHRFCACAHALPTMAQLWSQVPLKDRAPPHSAHPAAAHGRNRPAFYKLE